MCVFVLMSILVSFAVQPYPQCPDHDQDLSLVPR